MSIATIKREAHKEFDREFADSRYAQARAKQLKALLDKQMDKAFEAGQKEMAHHVVKNKMLKIPHQGRE